MHRGILLGLAALAAACDAGPNPPGQTPPPPAPAVAGPTVSHGLTREQAAQVVLRVGDDTVRLGELATLMGPPPRRRHQPPEAERRRAFLERLVRTELLADEAHRRRLDRGPESERARKQAMVERMLEDVLGAAHAREGDITDAELRAYYEANVERLTTPDMVHAAQILVASRARADAVMRELQGTGDVASTFAALARSESQDARTAQHGGDLGWFPREDAAAAAATDDAADSPEAVTSASLRPPVVPAAVRERAFAQQTPGSIAVVHSELGYHVVRYLGRRPAQRPPFEQIARTLRQQLADERRQKALNALDATLARDHHLERHTELLEQVRW